MAAYYNEIDPYAAAWLRNLIKHGQIAFGVVDERSIVDVKPEDLTRYTQCHFFAGIGGWSIALRQAGWSDDRSVWTGSCPCQPFSAAGQGKAADDERHLWPAWFSLIRELRPRAIFGEQVEAAVGWGWVDAVFNDLEAEGYACGAAVLPACSVGSPHIRQRIWFVGHAQIVGRQSGPKDDAIDNGGMEPGWSEQIESPIDGKNVGELANSDGGNASTERIQRSGQQRLKSQDSGVSGMADAPGEGTERNPGEEKGSRGARGVKFEECSRTGELADRTFRGRGEERQDGGRIGAGNGAQGVAAGFESGGDVGELAESKSKQRNGNGNAGRRGRQSANHRGMVNAASEQVGLSRRARLAGETGFWSDLEWLPCTDGKARPVEPGSFPLAHGVQRRASKLRAYGNAIVPQVAAQFIMASIND